jgi:RNA-directed DNA polymerase
MDHHSPDSRALAKQLFSNMDTHVWFHTKKFLTGLHPKKSWEWIRKRYFKPDKTGQSKNNWILTDPVSGNQLKKMGWTPIEGIRSSYTIIHPLHEAERLL